MVNTQLLQRLLRQMEAVEKSVAGNEVITAELPEDIDLPLKSKDDET